MMKKREETTAKNGIFDSKWGFILACVGSAVGLGNIWLFPYRLGQYGGAAFLIPYLFFILLFGYVGLSAEFGIGRMAQTGTIGAYETCWKNNRCKKAGKALGWIPLIGSLGIATGYAIIIGWVLRSLFGSATGELFNSLSSDYFAQATGDFGSIIWHFIILFLTLLILFTDSVARIEKVSKVMMPVFFILFTFLAVRVFFLPGSVEGYKFLFIPKWEALLHINTWVMAMGQAFFSLSITGSGMIVYGAYLKKEENIVEASLHTALFDTLAALLSALAIMPAVFSFGIEPTAGPSLMFLVIPDIFRQLAFGKLLACIFFFSVLLAGITSLINMFEAVIESLQYKHKIPRKAAAVISVLTSFMIGIFLENEVNVGSFMDFITILVVPFGAVFGAISIYFILGKNKIEDELNLGRKKKLPKQFFIVARYIYVPLTILIFILGIIYKGIG
ncbi:NSS family neurotransmitter:Na+ symporter [Lachnotalea glycerini]|uniref:NSS family neurotransmitter:Na+ symporter n=2 Tax=Lachnotalea glycerini TaxID=1763509 RepID=A0A318EN78_9FIRM|nr:sodium-dependent transporter [Lachnotalea glycerini]PXV86884.1 NSS family neurotransmitter:Na+ symporter [Lachnotalea glycerini]